MTRSACVLIVALSWMLACDDGGRGAARVTVRDSAGIRVVENREAIDSAVWTIGEPLLSIGVVEGEPAYELRDVVGAVMLGDGRIVLANSGSEELRWFDAEGRHIRSTGREGEGPGEFRSLESIFRYGPDSIVVYDRSLRRISVFDTAGRHGRVVSIASPGRNWTPSLVTPFTDGTLLVAVQPPFAPAATGGVYRAVGTVHHISATGEVLDSVASFAGPEIATGSPGGRPVVVGLPFGRSGSVAGNDAGVVVSDGGPISYDVFSPDGKLTTRVRLEIAPRLLTKTETDAYMAERMKRAQEQGIPEILEMERTLAELMQFPETYPGIAALYLDAAGNVWTEEARLADEMYLSGYELVRRYRIFNAEGRHTGSMSLPAGTRPLEIGEDWILLRAIDDLGVEYVRLHPLVRR